MVPGRKKKPISVIAQDGKVPGETPTQCVLIQGKKKEKVICIIKYRDYKCFIVYTVINATYSISTVTLMSLYYNNTAEHTSLTLI